jgi:hypothetical protein
MGKTTLRRKFAWLTATSILIAVPGVIAFHKVLVPVIVAEPAFPGLGITESSQDAAIDLDPIVQSTSPSAHTRLKNQKIAELYGISKKAKVVSETGTGEVRIDHATNDKTPDHTASPPRSTKSPAAKDDLLARELTRAEDLDAKKPVPSFRPAAFNTPRAQKEVAVPAHRNTQKADNSETSNVWVRKMAPGDSLDLLLSQSGILANQRYAITAAIAEKFDLNRLRPGNELRVMSDTAGDVESVVLHVTKGIRIEASVDDNVTVSVTRH